MNFDKFDSSGEPCELGARWNLWVERFNIFKLANGWAEDANIKSKFLSFLDSESFSVFSGLKKADGTDSLDDVIKFMTEYYNPIRSHFASRFAFNQLKQRGSETTSAFAARLKQQAALCDFKNETDARILEQLVAGSRNQEFKQFCLSSKDLDLIKAIKRATDHEKAEIDLKTMEKSSTDEIRFIRNQNQGKPTTSKQAAQAETSQYNQNANCRYCGQVRHTQRRDCPAYGKECRICGLKNHFASVCLSKNLSKQKGNFESGKRFQKPYQNHKSIKRVDFDETSQNASKSESNTSIASQKSLTISGDEIDEFIRFKEAKKFQINRVDDNTAKSVRVKASINHKNQQLEFIIDTGSPLTIISESAYHSLKEKSKLNHFSLDYKGFKSENKIPFLGEFECDIIVGNERARTLIQVVQGSCDNLLSLQTTEKLNLVRWNFVKQVKHSITRDLNELKLKFPNTFCDKLGCIKSIEYKLEVDENVKQVKQPLRPIAIHLREAVGEEIQRQVEAGILERVEPHHGPTPWVSNLVIVPKDRGVSKLTTPLLAESMEDKPKLAVRLTCDSRALNKAVKRTRYPTKTVEDIVHMVQGSTMFSKLDIKQAFHQLQLAEESRNLTTIATHIGLFRYKRLHMGISCASEIFTEVIRRLLESCPGQLNMTDDILVYGKTPEEHDSNLFKVLKTLDESGITLNSEKCEIGLTDIIFFGLRLTSNGIAPTDDRCRALKEIEPPSNPKELRSLLGLIQYSGRFLHNLHTLADPLWRMTRKNAEWKWGSVEQAALDAIKSKISNDCMAYFDTSLETELIVDASPVGLSAVLAQFDGKNKNEKHFISFASRLLSDTERRYSQCEKEALAAVWGCEKHWIYLIGVRFNLVTDNRAVKLIFNNSASKPPARIERWALRLTQFEFEVEHRPSEANVADYFSRHPIRSPVTAEDTGELNTENYINLVVQNSLPLNISLSEVIESTKKDTELILLSVWLTKKTKDKLPSELKAYEQHLDKISKTESGILLNENRIILPIDLRERAIKIAHKPHMGSTKTKALIREKIWFPDVMKWVDEEVNGCYACQANSIRQHFEPLKPSRMPDSAWQNISSDFYGPMSDGTYWLVTQCEYSRWVDVSELKSTSSLKVIPLFKRLFSLIGTPETLKTDNGPPFNSAEFANFAKEWGFSHRKITPYWPRSNSTAESFMKNLGQTVRKAKLENKSREDALQDFLRAYRETPHSTTGVAPNMLLFGFCRSSGLPSIQPNREQVLKAHEIAISNDSKAKTRMENEYNKRMRASESCIRPGTLVLLKSKEWAKSAPRWDPQPYTVVECNGSMITAIRDNHRITRNSSCFSIFRKRFEDMGDFDAANKQQTSIARTSKWIFEDEEATVVVTPLQNQPIIALQDEHQPVVVLPTPNHPIIALQDEHQPVVVLPPPNQPVNALIDEHQLENHLENQNQDNLNGTDAEPTNSPPLPPLENLNESKDLENDNKIETSASVTSNEEDEATLFNQDGNQTTIDGNRDEDELNNDDSVSTTHDDPPTIVPETEEEDVKLNRQDDIIKSKKAKTPQKEINR